MKSIFLLLILTASMQFAQTEHIDFHSPKNIKKFADYLYCDGDYLRAALEYNRLNNFERNDTVEFKKAISYSIIGNYSSALSYFSQISSSSVFYDLSKLERMKVFLLKSDFEELQNYYNDSFSKETSKLKNDGNSLFNFSYLLSDEELPLIEEFLSAFKISEGNILSTFYDWKKNPPYKSPVLAGISSALIPGSGKIYAGEIGDGIVGFLTTAVFSFIAYDNFKAGHNTRGWIWAGVAGLFYAGNVYGSVAAAHIHNAKITFEFNEDLQVYINNHNYFIPEYDFCK